MALQQADALSVSDASTGVTLLLDRRTGEVRYTHSMDRVDRVAIFTSILKRNALRRETGLPLLPVRETFRKEVLAAEWRLFCQEHAQAIWDELLAEKRRTDPDWGNSAGGMMALRLMTTKVLQERFARERLSK